MMHHVIPRNQRMAPEKTSPTQFAATLIQKLEILVREQQNKEKLDKCLLQGNQGNSQAVGNDMPLETLNGAVHKALSDAPKEKLSLEEDSDQAILDEHVSRVWSDLTPSRTPRLSPERRRPAYNYPQSYKQRKEKDVDSTFSVDSGNIHDFQDGNELVGASSMSSLGSHLPKSKSVPSDYADSLHKQDLYLQGKLNAQLVCTCGNQIMIAKLKHSLVCRSSWTKISKVGHDKTISHKEIDGRIDGQWSERRQWRAAFHK